MDVIIFLQIPTGSTATVTLPSASFKLQKLTDTFTCPNDFLTIKNIDESNTGQMNGTFPQDTGDTINSITLCGILGQDYTYTHVPGTRLQVIFRANNNTAFKGFKLFTCLS